MRWRTMVPMLVLLGGCDLPRDPENTLEQVRGGALRVGIIDQEPWAVYENDQARGVEAELVQRLADELDARVEWTPGGESKLLEQLARFELDLVIGGFVASSPWTSRVSTTIPHATTYENGQAVKHVFATPPGENGWIHRLDRFLFDHRNLTARPRLEGATP